MRDGVIYFLSFVPRTVEYRIRLWPFIDRQGQLSLCETVYMGITVVIYFGDIVRELDLIEYFLVVLY